MKNKKKILVLATSRKTRGGITAVVKVHEKGLQWNKYNIHWIETHVDSNIFLKLWYFVKSFVVFICLLPFYDLVHIHLSTFPSIFRKTFYMCWAKLWKKKIVTHLHCPSPLELFDIKKKWLYKFFFTSSDVIIVLSTQWKHYVEEALNIKNNIRVLYNPIISLPSHPLNFQKDNYVLFAGTIERRKGYHDLIHAFAKLLIVYPNWKLKFAGNGDISCAKQLVDTLGISSSVEFLGWITGAEKEKIFENASIFCLPSYAEGFPMAVLDAWAYGLPVVSTPVGGILDVAQNEKNILLFTPGDIQELYNQLCKLISNKALRDRMVVESNKLSASVFNQDRINAELSNIYAEILKE